MKYRIKISKSANFFFFISNLSEWHFSCDKKCNAEWIKQTGPLSDFEINALDSVRHILKKYAFIRTGKLSTIATTWDENSLEHIFFTKSGHSLWNSVDTIMSREERISLQNAFKIFRPRFKSIWDKRKNNIGTLSEFKRIIRDKRFTRLTDDLLFLFDSQSLPLPINLIILFVPFYNNETAAGTAIGQNTITISLPIMPKNSWQFDYTMGIVLHELAHIAFKYSKLKLYLFNSIQRQKLHIPNNKLDLFSIFEESIIDSFVPLGYIGQKYSEQKMAGLLLSGADKNITALNNLVNQQPISRQHLIHYIMWELYPLATTYGRNKKKIDDYYINFTLSIFKTFYNHKKRTS